MKGLNLNGAAGSFVSGVAAGIIGGPIGLVVLMTGANMVPAIYTEKKAVARAIEQAEKEVYLNNQTFFDGRIRHRFDLKKAPTQSEWAEISERYSRGESGGSILKSMGLID